MKNYIDFHNRIARNMYVQPKPRKISNQESRTLQNIGVLQNKIKLVEKRIDDLKHELAISNGIISKQIVHVIIVEPEYIEKQINDEYVKLEKLNNQMLIFENTLKAIREVEGVE
ncbi:MAG TPA: hypothetical protein VNR61_19180 [Niallia sp.]|nr:hypothetical protein [Niallia sp.]